MRDTFIAELARQVEADPSIMLITGDLGFKVLDDYRQRFPDNFLNAGVAEQNMTGLAVGMALSGRKVFTYSIGNFPTLRCLEQLRNDACYHGANVNVVVIGAGFSYGALGFSHHATEDVSILRALPGMTVVTPCDLWETTEATKALVAQPGPSCLRLDKMKARPTNRKGETFAVGKVRPIHTGGEVAVLASGGVLEEALAAREVLASENVGVSVYSAHSIKPWDEQSIIEIAKAHDAVVTLEEHLIQGALGGAVAETLLEAGVVPKRFKRVGLDNEISSVVGSQPYLRAHFGLDAVSLAETIRTVVTDL